VDNDQISRVEFFTWERKVGEDTSAPYEVSLDTTSLPDGLLMLRAVAHDRSGRSAENRRWPVVDNTDPLLEITGGPDGSTVGPGVILAWTFRTSDATSGLSVPPQSSRTMPSKPSSRARPPPPLPFCLDSRATALQELGTRAANPKRAATSVVPATGRVYHPWWERKGVRDRIS
jgi:hypothetical protein